MNELFTTLIPIFDTFIQEQENIQKLNKEKLAEIKLQWQNAINLPRKSKKKIRKRCEKEYFFWHNLGKYHKNLFTYE